MEALVNHLAPVVLALVALLGVAVAVVTTYRRYLAERHYLSILRQSAAVARLRELHNSHISDGHLSDEELSRLTDELEAAALSMKRAERHYILEALKQNSPKGRERYIDKVLEAA